MWELNDLTYVTNLKFKTVPGLVITVIINIIIKNKQSELTIFI